MPPPPDNHPYKYLSVSTTEIADYLRISRVTVFKWIKKGDLPASFVGRTYSVTIRDLEIYLKKEVDVDRITINRLWME